MTDNEIIKAFTVCITSEDCALCPMFRNCPTSLEVQRQTLNLINRQKEEIEILVGKRDVEKAKVKRLKEELKTIAVDQKVVKAFAIKDFSHFLIDKAEGGVISVADLSDLTVEWGETQ